MIKKNLKVTKSKKVVLKALVAVRDVASSSEWNFAGKLHLLEAEQRVVELGTACLGNLAASHYNVLSRYDSAIAHAKKSRFIHEEGLACEKAGLYCKKVQDYGRAQSYFNQALVRYSEWGSNVKVAFIQNELNSPN
jgi:hypothetical protein